MKSAFPNSEIEISYNSDTYVATLNPSIASISTDLPFVASMRGIRQLASRRNQPPLLHLTTDYPRNLISSNPRNATTPNT